MRQEELGREANFSTGRRTDLQADWICSVNSRLPTIPCSCEQVLKTLNDRAGTALDIASDLIPPSR